MKIIIIFLLLLSCCISADVWSIYSPDKRVLLIGAKDNAIMRINPDTGKSISTLSFWNPIYNFKYTANDRYIIVSSKDEIYLLNPDTLSFYKSFKSLGTGPVVDADLTPNGKYIIATTQNNNQIVIVETFSKKILKRVHVQYTPAYLMMAPSNKFAYITTKNDKFLIQINLSTFDYKYIKKYS